MRFATFVFLAALVLPPLRGDAQPSPAFTITASTAPSAEIFATVKRVGRPDAISASLVPFLEKGDVVTIMPTQFVNAKTRYHVNVDFISGAGFHWLYPPNDDRDKLFDYTDAQGKVHHPQPIVFTYGVGGLVGKPIVVIVPEDRGAGNLDPGARAYVDANMTSFATMAESSNEAVNEYTWFQSFLQGLGNGALYYPSGQSRAIALGGALGATNLASCSTQPNAAAVQNCMYSQVSALAPISQPSSTTANLLGVALTAAVPAPLTPFVAALGLVVKLFGIHGRDKYEYLPAPLYPRTIGPNTDQVPNLLQPAAVPGVRPMAAISDVVFFTIGAQDNANSRPAVTYSGDAIKQSMCANDPEVPLQLGLNEASIYVHDAHLVVRPVTPGAIREIPIDQRVITNPILDREQTADSTNGFLDDGTASAYVVSLAANYGFDTVKQGAVTSEIVAIPRHASWTLDKSVIGLSGPRALTVTSPNAACLSEIDLMQGNSDVPVETWTGSALTQIDSKRIQFTYAPQQAVGGNARFVFMQNDRAQQQTIADSFPVNLASSPQASPPPLAYLRDPFVFVRGAALDSTTGINLGGTIVYKAAPSITASRACYVGAALAGVVPGHTEQGTFISSIGAGPFTLTIDDARPEITRVSAPVVHRQVMLQNVPADVALSTDYVSVQVSGGIPTRAPFELPASIGIGVRSKAASTNDPCEALSAAYPRPSSPGASNPASPQVTPIGSAGTTILAFFRPADLLASQAAGPLQVQLIDNSAGVGSDWVDVPGLTVTEAPDIESVTCDESRALCTVVGTQLQTIQSVFDENGKPVLLGFCPPPTGKQCMQLTTQSKVLRVQLSGLTSLLTINQNFIKAPTPEATKRP